MRTDELDYALPEELIAQRPAERRDASRLLVHRRDGTIEHRRFADLVDLLDPAISSWPTPAACCARASRCAAPSGGGGEVLLLEERPDGLWEALVRPSRRMRPGVSVAAVEGRAGDRAGRGISARAAGSCGRRSPAPSSQRALERAGRMPLPPYIRDPAVPDERYQTVYARRPGSAAAPTAGLHFTAELWQRLRARCEVVEVELRVGLDTFRPVTAGTLEEHPMHSEAYRVEPAARAAILGAVAANRRVVCIGTTSVRVVETVADPAAPDEGRTSLLIAPGYRFRAVGALVTNFHLPRSTLLALVMALCGVEETRRIYAEAIRERYRFYSFGDASLPEPEHTPPRARAPRHPGRPSSAWIGLSASITTWMCSSRSTPRRLGALVDVVAVDAGRERLLLELLAHAARLERGEALRAHEAAGVHEAGQLVAGEEHALEVALALRDVLQVVRMREHGAHEPLGIAQLAQVRRAVLRVLVERGMALVVEVVQQRHVAPRVLVVAALARIGAHGGLDRVGVAPQRLALRPALQERERRGAVAREGLSIHGAQS